jgi:hypothetical protein
MLMQSLLAQAQVTTTGPNSPASNTHIGDNNWPQTILNYTKNINNYTTSKSLNSLERKQEALLVAGNPTNLDVSDILFMNFFGDDGPQLTIKLINHSNLPALNVHAYLPDEKGKPRKDIKLPNMLKMINSMHVAIPTQKELWFPLASIADIRKLLQLTDAEKDYCIYAASEYPMDLSHKMPLSEILPAESRAIAIQYTYETVLQEKKVQLLSGSIYLSPGERNPSNSTVTINGALHCLD